ncbi:MAG: hypothetical protein AAF791_03295 [Bacteroidota bacterium]
MFCRLVVGLALAGLLGPLVPAAEAKDTTAARLAEALGHAEAVQSALDASRHAADPLAAFVQAYAYATGQDAADVRARLVGDALWLATEIPAPQATPAPTGPAATPSGRALSATLARSPALTRANAATAVVHPVPPDVPRSERPRAHGARGP